MATIIIVFVRFFLHFCKPKCGFRALENKKQATKPPFQPMKGKNNLKTMLEALGIKELIPTDKVLSDSLEGMTLKRFNKLLNNSPSARAMTAIEAVSLSQWLTALTGRYIAPADLFTSAEKEVAS